MGLCLGHTVWGWVGFYVRLENQAKLAVYTRLTSTSFHRHMELFVELSFSLGPYISDIETFNIMRPTSLNENIVACHVFRKDAISFLLDSDFDPIGATSIDPLPK